MFGPVVVTLDGAAAAEAVIPFAAQLAGRSRAELHLTQVHELTTTLRKLNVSDASCGLAAREEARAHLRALAKRWTRQGVTTRAIVLDGGVVTALLQHIESTQATFVVTATRTAPTLRRVFSGHVDDALIRFAQAPVVVCATPAGMCGKGAQLQRIVVALDGSELAERTLDAIVPLLAGVDVHLIQAVCFGDSLPMDADLPLSEAIPRYVREQRDYAEHYLASKAALLRERAVRTSTSVAEGLWPAQTIVLESMRLKADLLAVATHGRTGFARRALGSCAADVLRAAGVPVLVVGPRVKYSTNVAEPEAHSAAVH